MNKCVMKGVWLAGTALISAGLFLPAAGTAAVGGRASTWSATAPVQANLGGSPQPLFRELPLTSRSAGFFDLTAVPSLGSNLRGGSRDLGKDLLRQGVAQEGHPFGMVLDLTHGSALPATATPDSAAAKGRPGGRETSIASPLSLVGAKPAAFKEAPAAPEWDALAGRAVIPSVGSEFGKASREVSRDILRQSVTQENYLFGAVPEVRHRPGISTTAGSATPLVSGISGGPMHPNLLTASAGGPAQTLFREPPMATGRSASANQALMPYVGLGFGGGEPSDLTRQVLRQSVTQEDRSFRDLFSKSLVPSEFHLGLRLFF